MADLKNHRTSGWLLLLAFALFISGTLLFSQQRRIHLQKKDLTDLPWLRLCLTVTDEQGDSILGLTEKEVTVSVDGAPQKIESLKSALQGGEFIVRRDFIASKGPGISLEAGSRLERKIARQNIIFPLGGSLFGALFEFLIIDLIKLARPQSALPLPYVVALILSAVILGAIIKGIIFIMT